MNLTLKEFVSETITAIVDGVCEAQKRSGWRKVNPPLSPCDVLKISEQQGFMTGADGELVQKVEFDVAVEASKEKESKAGLRVFVVGASAGLFGNSSQKASTISRVKFCVPLSLPTGKESAEPQVEDDTRKGA